MMNPESFPKGAVMLGAMADQPAVIVQPPPYPPREQHLPRTIRDAVLNDPLASAAFTQGRIEERQRVNREVEQLRDAVRRAIACYGKTEGRMILQQVLEETR